MDRKEAILRIKEHMKHHGIGKYPHLKLKEALDMAIAALSQPNEPMTLEQLREMDGEPVYLVAQRYGISEWNILNGMDEIVLAYDEPVVGMKAVIPGIKFINGRVLGVGSYDEDWLAYRRPPEVEK